MKVSSLMITDPITITEKTSIQEAIECMKVNSIRHLPVVTGKKKLKGFVTLADLKQGFIPSMVSDVSLKDLTITNPITVEPDDDVEVAARLIYNHKIGGMPVVTKGKVVGIITESDILRAFIELMGILSSGSRIDIIVENKPGSLKKALQIIHNNGGDIINVVQQTFEEKRRVYCIRLSDDNSHNIETALKENGFEVLDALT